MVNNKVTSNCFPSKVVVTKKNKLISCEALPRCSDVILEGCLTSSVTL